MDIFVGQMEEVIERFAKLQEDIERKRAHLETVTGFEMYKKSHEIKLRHPVIGILIDVYTAADGDKSKVKVECKERKPYLQIRMSGITSVELTKNVEALDDYFEEVGDAFEVKVPRLV